MDLSLSLVLVGVMLAIVQLDCRHLQERSARHTSHSCTCSKRQHVQYIKHEPETSTNAQDLPSELLRQRNPSKTYQESMEFVDGERCMCGCHVKIATDATTTTEEILTPATTEMVFFDAEDSTLVNYTSQPTTEIEFFDAEDDTVTIRTGPTTTEASGLYKYNTTCTESECLTVVSHPDKGDATLRYRCVPPSKCPFFTKAQPNNPNEGQKVNGETGVSNSDKGGVQSSPQSSHFPASHQNPSGYHLPGRHVLSSSNSAGGGDHSYGASNQSTGVVHTPGIGGGAKPASGQGTSAAVPLSLNNRVATSPRTPQPSVDSHQEHDNFPKNIPAPPNCGVFNATLFKRIVGGSTATALGKWQWMVAYGYKKAEDGPDQVKWLCGGALVTAKSSITAAHCLSHPTRKLSVARFGDLDLEDDEDGANHVTKEVLQGMKHPQFNDREYAHDIAIVVLKTPLRFTSTIKPICLPFLEDMKKESFDGMEPYIAGWGNLEFNTGDNSMLYEAQLPIVSREECAKVYGERFKRVITSGHICAGANGKDACQGDSGGPLMVPWKGHFYTIGVVSWGYRCGLQGYPGVFTRVTSYLDWLQENIK